MQDEKLWLLLKERALESTAEGVVISDCTREGMPIIYVNKAFTKMTGYSSSEVLGRNCRFLQGEDTDSNTKDTIRKALLEKYPCIVEILNYRKDATPFWNRLSITPVKDDQGLVTHFIGIQSDITRRRQAEDSLRAANDRINRDLKAAAKLQKAQLPLEIPIADGYKFAWNFQPCQQLAGDTLNILRIDDSHISVYVLDVCGHGVRASLHSYSINQDLRPHSGGPNLLSPTDLFKRLNVKYPLDIETGMFFTILYGVLDTQSGEFIFASAGHPGPILLSNNRKPEIIDVHSFPIGINPEAMYTSKTIKLTSGDKLIMHTDGVVDAFNANGEQFGHNSLLELLQRNRNESIDKIISSVVSSLYEWIHPTSLKDDLSLVAIEAV